ncbi:hypothetical protein ACWEN3_19370 [Streptomyces sp. NPDC004561]
MTADHENPRNPETERGAGGYAGETGGREAGQGAGGEQGVAGVPGLEGAEVADGPQGGGGVPGVDALMAAVSGEPLPEEARWDPGLLAEHRAAEADVALLKEQLVRLAEALTGEPQAPEEPGRPGHRPRHPTRPYGRPPRSRRASRVALGALAGAAACSLVVGLGWLVTHPAGGSDDRSAGAKSVAGAPDKVSGDGGRPSDPELDLACSKLVVEGTVAGVRPQKLSPWTRVTLTVIRSYKPAYGPAHGPAEVGFLLDGGAKPAPRKGQHVLVRVGRGQPAASLWAVGDARVAADRAWIEKALPGSRHVTCPSGHSS